MDITSLVAALVGFLATALLGIIVIPFLRKLKFGQTILEEGPNWHKSKEGTPTMGGIMMILGFLLAMACAYGYAAITRQPFVAEVNNNVTVHRTLTGIVMALCMAGIGFADDYIKVVKKRNLGLNARQKTFLQLFVSAGYLAVLCLNGMTETYIPFVGNVNIVSGWGLLFWPIALLFIYGFTNAVNLTDGIDGLASSVTLVVACAFMVGAGLIFNYSVNAMSAALAGVCVGFVYWNGHPAKVFMGDTGSMFLGGAVVALSFGLGRPILLIFAGITYFLEALSDIIQVLYYKKTKKRIFKMAPLHHHFEMCGWSEKKIVLVFSLITCIGCVIALLPIFFNI